MADEGKITTATPDHTLASVRHENALLRRELRDVGLLLKITSVLHRALDLDEVVRILLTAVTAGSALGYNRAVLFLIDATGRRLVGYSAVGPLSGEEASHIWNRVTDGQSFEQVVALATAQRPEEGEFHRRVRELRLPLEPGRSVIADAVARGGAICVETAHADPRVPAALRELLATSSLVVAPLVASGRACGAVVADYRFTGRAIRDEDVELLETLARHGGLAVERAQTHARVARRLDERARLHEISKGILSTVELDRELETIAQASARLMGAERSTLWLFEESSRRLRVATTFGHGADRLAGDQLRRVEEIARRAIDSGSPVTVDGGEGDQLSAFLCVPLFALDHPVGAISVFSKSTDALLGAPHFSEEDQEILAVLADQAAIAIQNARLFERIRRTEKRLREAEGIRARFEKLAALGEMSAKVSHEIRTPLTSIGGFARQLLPHFAAGTGERRATEIIVSETERLERILTTQLDFANLSRPRPRLCDLNRVLEEVMELVVEEAARHQVRVVSQLGSGLPRLLVDVDHIKQMLLNLIQNGVESLPGGGRLRLTTGRLAAHVLLEVATDGEPIPGDMLDRLFVPFSTSKRGGTGLGLAVAHQIVREHGGQIRARSEGEWGAIFSVYLPVRGNEDRRSDRDRRQRLWDRRDVHDPALEPGVAGDDRLDREPGR